MNRINKILLSPFFLSLVLCLIIIPFLPFRFSKYAAHVVEHGTIARSLRTAVFYQDLDSDGNSDRIISDSNFAYHSIRVYDHNNGIWSQENFRGNIPKKHERIFFGDQDEDGYLEIYAFTQREDSLFLNVVETMDQQSVIRIRDKYITSIRKRDGRYEYAVRKQQMMDLTGDSIKDLLFSVEAQFSLQPRKLFLLDFKNDTMWQSPESGTTMENLWIADLNDDGKPEITGSVSAAGNIHDSLGIPFHDYSAWLMSYTREFQFLFPPVEFPGFRSEVLTAPYYEGNLTRILMLYNTIGQLNDEPVLSIYDAKGTLMQSRKLEGHPKMNRKVVTEQFADSQYHYFLIEGNGRIFAIEKDLSLKPYRHLGADIVPDSYSFDLDGDGSNEKVFALPGDSLTNVLITRNDFRYPVSLTFNSKLTSESYISLIDRAGEKRSFYVMNGSIYMVYQYARNPFYSLRLLIFAGIYSGLLLFILMIMKFQRIRLQKQHEQYNRLLELQLKSVNNQLDPHFTFNAFNSIAAIIQEGDREEAYRSFTKFAGLIRSNLEYSNKISRTLEEELQFVTNYLDLQKLRFKDQLVYEIHISENVDKKRLIPKMLIQIFVENAIKHGLRHKKGKGSLRISIDKQDKLKVITIEDDGIGREAAKAYATDSTGIGLQIMEQFYILFREYYKVRISHEIIDLYDENGQAAGTRVIVSIPQIPD